jgi:hypothetical protein
MVNKLHDLNQNFIQKRIKELELNYFLFRDKFNEKYCKYKKYSSERKVNYEWTTSLFNGLQKQMYTDNLPILADTLDCNILELLSDKAYILSIEPKDINATIVKLDQRYIQHQIQEYSLSRFEFFYLFTYEYQRQFNMSPIAELIDRLYNGTQNSLYHKTLPILATVLQCSDINLLTGSYKNEVKEKIQNLKEQIKQLELQLF